MKKKFNYLLLLACTVFINVVAFAQERLPLSDKPEMAVGMRANGKIYVVVAVLVTILAGVVLYLVNLDRKIRQLEKSTGTP